MVDAPAHGGIASGFLGRVVARGSTPRNGVLPITRFSSSGADGWQEAPEQAPQEAAFDPPGQTGVVPRKAGRRQDLPLPPHDAHVAGAPAPSAEAGHVPSPASPPGSPARSPIDRPSDVLLPTPPAKPLHSLRDEGWASSSEDVPPTANPGGSQPAAQQPLSAGGPAGQAQTFESVAGDEQFRGAGSLHSDAFGMLERTADAAASPSRPRLSAAVKSAPSELTDSGQDHVGTGGLAAKPTLPDLPKPPSGLLGHRQSLPHGTSPRGSAGDNAAAPADPVARMMPSRIGASEETADSRRAVAANETPTASQTRTASPATPAGAGHSPSPVPHRARVPAAPGPHSAQSEPSVHIGEVHVQIMSDPKETRAPEPLAPVRYSGSSAASRVYAGRR